MIIASETIVGAIKDGPKRERTFLAEDQSSKRKPEEVQSLQRF